MREYLFRGKRTDTKEWIYGSLLQWPDGDCYICAAGIENEMSKVQVIPETVGQLSGHENKLFEGDIVNYVTGNPKRYVNRVVRFGEYETYTKIVDNDPDYNNDAGEVEKHIGFYLEDGSAKIPIGSVWIEKIGNIFDNPELLTTTTNT